MFTKLLSYQYSGLHGPSLAQPEARLSKVTAKMKKAAMKCIVAGVFAGFTLALAVNLIKNGLSEHSHQAHRSDKDEGPIAVGDLEQVIEDAAPCEQGEELEEGDGANSRQVAIAASSEDEKTVNDSRSIKNAPQEEKQDEETDAVKHQGSYVKTLESSNSDLMDENKKLKEDIKTLKTDIIAPKYQHELGSREREDLRNEVAVWKAHARKAWNDKLAREERDIALEKPGRPEVQKNATVAIVVEDIEDITFVQEEVTDDKEHVSGDMNGQGILAPKSMDNIPDATVSYPTATSQDLIAQKATVTIPAQDVGDAESNPGVDDAERVENTVETPITDGDAPSKPKRHRKRHHKRAKDRLPAPIPVDVHHLPSRPQSPFRPSPSRPQQAPLPPRFQVAGAPRFMQPPVPYSSFGRAVLPSSRQPMGAFYYVKQRREQREQRDILQGDSRLGSSC